MILMWMYDGGGRKTGLSFGCHTVNPNNSKTHWFLSSIHLYLEADERTAALLSEMVSNFSTTLVDSTPVLYVPAFEQRLSISNSLYAGSCWMSLLYHPKDVTAVNIVCCPKKHGCFMLQSCDALELMLFSLSHHSRQSNAFIPLELFLMYS